MHVELILQEFRFLASAEREREHAIDNVATRIRSEFSKQHGLAANFIIWNIR